MASDTVGLTRLAIAAASAIRRLMDGRPRDGDEAVLRDARGMLRDVADAARVAVPDDEEARRD